MTNDDPSLREFRGYLAAKEPGRRERADAWATAIGLQKVDGLSTSQYLRDTARDHIEGRVTQAQARRRIRDYYAAKDETAKPDPDLEEPDKVAERIAAVINDGGFAFTPEYFISLHAKLFRGVLPFGEGNTRTTAVFAIKYLRSLGYRATNNMFRENSWYFRNALVRANYADYARGVKREWTYLERFFRNLLLGEKNELKSRYLLIGYKPGDVMSAEKKVVGKSGKKKAVRKSGKKTVERIWELLRDQPHLTFEGMVAALGITRSTIQKHIANLKSAGRLRRIGPDKGGHWEVVG